MTIHLDFRRAFTWVAQDIINETWYFVAFIALSWSLVKDAL